MPPSPLKSDHGLFNMGRACWLTCRPGATALGHAAGLRAAKLQRLARRSSAGRLRPG